ncbi:MAG: T9SS type A sorting domain-containing protein [bacterium]|nr:T9SS type A sorting domain-containing protein [bacterium]
MIYAILMGFVLALTQGNVERKQDGNLRILQTKNNTKTAFFSDTTFILKDTLIVPQNLIPGPGQLSKDGLKYYASIADSTGNYRLYVMSRNNLKEEFDSLSLTKLPGNINDVDTFSNSQPTITEDGKIMVFTKSWDNNWDNNDLWIAVRNSLTDPFDSLRPLSEINITDTADAYPWISPNGLHLYFAQEDSQGVYLYMASRSNRDSLFGAKESLKINFPGTNNFSCFLTNNELEIYFRAGIIYYAKRGSIGDTFSTPEAMPEFSGIGFVSGLSLTPDSSELYLYNVPDTTGKWILKFINSKSGVEEPLILDFGLGNADLQIIKGKIYLSAPKSINTELKIYDLCGRLQSTVYQGLLSKGDYTFTPNIKKSGVYFVRLTTNNFKETKKMVLIK